MLNNFPSDEFFEENSNFRMKIMKYNWGKPNLSNFSNTVKHKIELCFKQISLRYEKWVVYKKVIIISSGVAVEYIFPKNNISLENMPQMIEKVGKNFKILSKIDEGAFG